jgi:transposase
MATDPEKLKKTMATIKEQRATLPDRSKQAAREGLTVGMDPTEIAFRLGVTPATIYTWAKEAKS